MMTVMEDRLIVLNAEIARLRAVIQWIENIATINYEQDDKLRAEGARTLKRIADRCSEVMKCPPLSG